MIIIVISLKIKYMCLINFILSRRIIKIRQWGVVLRGHTWVFQHWNYNFGVTKELNFLKKIELLQKCKSKKLNY